MCRHSGTMMDLIHPYLVKLLVRVTADKRVAMSLSRRSVLCRGYSEYFRRCARITGERGFIFVFIFIPSSEAPIHHMSKSTVCVNEAYNSCSWTDT